MNKKIFVFGLICILITCSYTSSLDTILDNNQTNFNIKITKPESGLYINNIKIRRYIIRKPLIIGPIDIQVESKDKNVIEKIEFYINNELRHTDYNFSYMWSFGEKAIGKYTIKVIAYDKNNNNVSDEKVVWIFNMKNIYKDSFEEGLNNWQVGSDLPDQPGNPGTKIYANVSLSSTVSHSGKNSVLFKISGQADNGTIWLYKNISVKNGLHNVKLSIYVFDRSNYIYLCYFPLYIGTSTPDKESDFLQKYYNGKCDGWRKLAYRKTVQVENKKIVIAFGISVVWESGVGIAMDDVKIEYN